MMKPWFPSAPRMGVSSRSVFRVPVRTRVCGRVAVAASTRPDVVSETRSFTEETPEVRAWAPRVSEEKERGPPGARSPACRKAGAHTVPAARLGVAPPETLWPAGEGAPSPAGCVSGAGPGGPPKGAVAVWR